MKQVEVFEDCDIECLKDKVNKELSKWDSDNTEVVFNATVGDEWALYSAMIIIKDCK